MPTLEGYNNLGIKAWLLDILVVVPIVLGLNWLLNHWLLAQGHQSIGYLAACVLGPLIVSWRDRQRLARAVDSIHKQDPEELKP